MTEDELHAAVLEDIRCHRESGADLNPYSVPGRRSSWQRGFDGQPEVLLDYEVAYERGQLAAKLIKEPA